MLYNVQGHLNALRQQRWMDGVTGTGNNPQRHTPTVCNTSSAHTVITVVHFKQVKKYILFVPSSRKASSSRLWPNLDRGNKKKLDKIEATNPETRHPPPTLTHENDKGLSPRLAAHPLGHTDGRKLGQASLLRALYDTSYSCPTRFGGDCRFYSLAVGSTRHRSTSTKTPKEGTTHIYPKYQKTNTK